MAEYLIFTSDRPGTSRQVVARVRLEFWRDEFPDKLEVQQGQLVASVPVSNFSTGCGTTVGTFVWLAAVKFASFDSKIQKQSPL